MIYDMAEFLGACVKQYLSLSGQPASALRLASTPFIALESGSGPAHQPLTDGPRIKCECCGHTFPHPDGTVFRTAFVESDYESDTDADDDTPVAASAFTRDPVWSSSLCAVSGGAPGDDCELCQCPVCACDVSVSIASAGCIVEFQDASGVTVTGRTRTKRAPKP